MGWRGAFLLLALGASIFAAEAPRREVNPRFSGTPVTRIWTTEELGSPANVYSIQTHPQNGLIYVGTNIGIVELDGARTRLIRHEPFDAAAIHFDRRGRLWKGASDDIQVSTPDAAGEWQTESFRHRPPPGSTQITKAYHGLDGPGGVYFTDFHHLYRFADAEDRPRAWQVASGSTEITTLWAMDGGPWVGLSDGTVLRLRNNAMERVPGFDSGALAGRGLPGGGWQLLTRNGVDLWDGSRRTNVSRPFGDEIAHCALFLANGGIAFGTVSGGVIICDRDGRFLQRIDRTRGLPANSVRALVEDREGGLWVALFTSVARVQLDSPYARHGAQQGIEGMTQSFIEHRGALYVGTTEGMFRREADGRFSRIQSVEPQVRRFVSHGDTLFIVAQGLFALAPADGDRARRLTPRVLLGLVPFGSQPDVFLFGSNDGAGWARSDGRSWQQEGQLTSVAGAADVVFQGPPGVIWVRTTKEMWRFDLRGGLAANPPEIKLTPERGLPHRDVRMFQLGESMVAITQDGGRGQMLRFDDATGTLVPELRIAGLVKSARYPNAAGEVDRVITDPDGTIWMQMPEPLRPIYRAQPSGPDRWQAEPLAGPTLAATRANALWHQSATRTLWVGAPGGLMSRDLDWRPTRESLPPPALVRGVALASGKSLYGGAVLQSTAGPLSKPQLATLQPNQNALRVAFAAPWFPTDHLGKAQVTYRTRLDGLDADWSDWTQETQRDFTNLPWRDFLFRVQARDGQGRIGPEGTLAFSIAAPWWGSRWAWGGYGTLALLGVAGVVRLRTRVLHRRAARLEVTITERTRELADSNAQLATQNTELARLHRLELDEKLAAQLAEEKARLELLRYQLNPHFLLNAFTTLRYLVHSSPEKAGTMVERLADFCRLALTRSDENASVDDEVKLIESYLDTEKARWRDELAVEFAVDPAARPKPLPPFLLQPLVENAIKYGGRTSPGTLRLRISISWTGDALLIEIANTGEWVPTDSPHRRDSTGIGLENLRQRLRRQYRDAHTFTTEARDGWVFVRLSLGRKLSLNLAHSALEPLTKENDKADRE